MGYQGGRYAQWMDRVNSSSSRPLLLENPRCFPGDSSLFQCDWNSRRVGAGVCGEFGLSPISLVVVIVREGQATELKNLFHLVVVVVRKDTLDSRRWHPVPIPPPSVLFYLGLSINPFVFFFSFPLLPFPFLFKSFSFPSFLFFSNKKPTNWKKSCRQQKNGYILVIGIFVVFLDVIKYEGAYQRVMCHLFPDERVVEKRDRRTLPVNGREK